MGSSQKRGLVQTLGLALLTLLSLGLPRPAYASERIAELTAIVADAGCLAPGYAPSAEGLVAVAATWAGLSIDKLRELAGVEAAANLSDEAVIERLLEAAASGIGAIEADLGMLLWDICPVLLAEIDPWTGAAPRGASFLAELEARQRDLGPGYRPYLAAAEAALTADNRQTGPIDGVFDEQSRAAWIETTTALTQIYPEIDEYFALSGRAPTPAQVAMLIAALSFGEDTGWSSAAEDLGLAYFWGTAPPDYYGVEGASQQRQMAVALLAGTLTTDSRYFFSSAFRAGVISLLPAMDWWTRTDAYSVQNYDAVFGAYLGLRTGTITVDRAMEAILGFPVQYCCDSGSTVTWIRIASLAFEFPELRARLLSEAGDWTLYTLAVIFIDGRSSAGRNPGLGVEFLRAAAAKGGREAQYHLGVALEYGLGGSVDGAAAIAAYRAAARQGHGEAAFALGRIYEDGDLTPRDLSEATWWYTIGVVLLASDDDDIVPEDDPPTAFGRAWNQWTGASDLGVALAQRIVEGSFLSTGEGRDFLEHVIVTAGGEVATALGDAFVCTDCGAPVDLQQAAYWYRVAIDNGDAQAALRLVPLLANHPEEATDPDELDRILAACTDYGCDRFTLIRPALGVADPPAPSVELTEYFDGCGVDFWIDDCLYLAHDLAVGAINVAWVALGYDAIIRLLDRANDFLDLVAAFPGEPGAAYTVQDAAERLGLSQTIRYFDESSVISVLVAAADVMAFYGEFDSANRTLLRLTSLRLSDYSEQLPGIFSAPSSSARNAVFRRLAANVANGSTAPEGLAELLSTLADAGDDFAGRLLQVLAAGGLPPLATVEPLADLEARLVEQTARGLSEGLATTARSLGAAWHAAGDPLQALRYELTALRTEIALFDATDFINGPIPTALARTCAYSRSSHRLMDYGFSDAALVLAKVAVNELQLVRRQIAQLPEHLQVCFSDLVSDSYRWLADLLIGQNRLDEAVFVMGLLDDFETFQFVERDEAYLGRAFDRFNFNDIEELIWTAIDDIGPPLTELGRRQRELRLRLGTLTTIEQAELDAITATLEDEDTRIDAIVADIAALRGAADQCAPVTAADAGDLPPEGCEARQAARDFRGRLRNEFDGRAVAIQYVVLPGRMHAILTTPTARIAHTWDTLDGNPFAEEALNALVAAFRSEIQDPASNPLPAAQAFYDFLIAPFAREIAAAEATTILFTPDRQLRYLPLAALYDGENYLIEDFTLIQTAGVENAAPSRSGERPIAALGVTAAAEGFAALPAVALEVDGLVRAGAADDFGLLPGRVLLDQSFSRQTLAAAMIFDGELGILHLATHFQLGTSEGNSFLLTGNGPLSVRDLEDGIGAEFDLGDLELLTLSACETAFGVIGADGRDLKSFAAIAIGSGGPRAVVATLWPIADATTAVLMHRFYELAASGERTYAEALAEAMREFASGTIAAAGATGIVAETARRGTLDLAIGTANASLGISHPYYWAPFVFFGGY